MKTDFPANPRPNSEVPTSFISLLPSGQTERPPEPVLGVLRAALGLGHVRRDRADELEGRVEGLSDALHLRQGAAHERERRGQPKVGRGAVRAGILGSDETKATNKGFRSTVGSSESLLSQTVFGFANRN